MRGVLARYKTLVTAAAFIGAIIAYPLLLPDSYHLGIGISAGDIASSSDGLGCDRRMMAVYGSGVSTLSTAASMVWNGWLALIAVIEKATSSDVTG